MQRGSSPDQASASRVLGLRRQRWVVLALVGAPVVLILLIMLGFLNLSGAPEAPLIRFPDLLRPNTPNSGDIGAHILLPKVLTESVLASGRLFGWSNAWFAGFPVLHLYFPLPMLAIVILNGLLPYGVAVKLVVSAGLIALPISTYLFVRWLGFERLVAGVAAVMGGAFVFMESYSVFGGNIKSTLAGEFSFSWSFALAVLYLGLLVRQTRSNGLAGLLPGVVLALVALSHIVSAIVLVVVSAPLLARRSTARRAAMSWLIGFGLSAFWVVPFAHIVLSGLSTDLGWENRIDVFGRGSPLPTELVPVLVLAIGGFAWSVKRRERIDLLVAITVIPLGLYFLLPTLGLSNVHNGRFLPYWYYGVFVFAGIGIGCAATTLARRVSASRNAPSLAAGIAAALILSSVIVVTNDVPVWVTEGFSGYESASGWNEYEQLVDSIDRLPPGRVVWEYNADLFRFGSPLALMAIPYWSEEHPTMKGLYVESSLTTPFNFLNESEISREPSFRIPGLRYHGMDFGRATAHLALYDVRYYVSFTDESADAAIEFGLTPLASADTWTVFALPQSGEVEVATSEPSVWSGDSGFTEASLMWYDDTAHLDRWLTESGPTTWARVAAVEDRVIPPVRAYDAEQNAVSNVRIEDHQISFDTSAVGVPHLVKVSYFPSWQAEGADGPYRAAPSLMVVVPTEESVVLRFGRTAFEYLGIALTLLTVVAMGAYLFRNRRTNARRSGRL